MGKLLKTGWYVLYVRSRHEKKVHDLLIEQGLESFLPLVETINQWSDRKKKFRNLFFYPIYLFKINSSLDFHKVLSIDGACTFISFGNQYARVTEKEILNIKLFIGSDEISDIEISNQSFQVGEVRMINYGSLRGLECEILKVNNTNKIIVRIDSLQQNIIATVPSHHMVSLQESA